MIIKESAENYLESILSLKKANGSVRSIDVANDLCVSKPSVSVAMKNFREEGYITVDENGFLDLTEKGLKIAENVYNLSMNKTAHIFIQQQEETNPIEKKK